MSSSKSAGPPKVVIMGHSPAASSSASPPHELLLDQAFLTTPSTTNCVEGLQLQGDMLAVWSLQDVRVYRLHGSTTLPSLVASLTVPKPIVTLALHSRALLVALADENKVDVYLDLYAKCAGDAAAVTAAVTAAASPSTALPFSAKEGCPLFIDIQGNILAVATDKRVLKLFCLDKGGVPQQRSSAGRLVLPEGEEEKEGEEEGKCMTLTSMRLNADATRVSFILSSTSFLPSIPTCLCIYDVDRDVAHAVSCLPAAATSPTTHTWDAEDPKLLVCLCSSTSKPSKSTINARNVRSRKHEGKGEEGKEDRGVVVTLLVSPDEAQVTCLDSFPLSSPLGNLLGVQAPYFYFTSSSTSSSPTSSTLPSSLVLKRTMRDFVGLEYDSLHPTAQAALKAFHYHLLTQDWHAAHQALKILSLRQQQRQQQQPKGRGGRELGDGCSTAQEQQQQQQQQQQQEQQLVCVWRNMARLCLQTRRVDVAELCLGHMGHVRGLTAVREAAATASACPSLPPSSSSSTDVSLAMVAIQLGLLKEAAALYTHANRFDLLNRMYQAAGQWEEALRVAETEDRLHLKTTHFEYARQLEGVGEWEKAVGHYEKSGAQAREVPRMLLKAGKVVGLEEYVKKERKGGKEEGKEEEEGRVALWQWWGRYCESKGDMKGAKEAYEEASDLVALVRLACVTQDVAAAEALLEDDRTTTTRKATTFHEQHHPLRKIPTAAVRRAASYHLARHYEGALHDVLPALTHYARAGCFQHCLRLAMAHELDGDVIQFALQSDRERLMRQSARYFADRGQEERARELLNQAEGKRRRK